MVNSVKVYHQPWLAEHGARDVSSATAHSHFDSTTRLRGNSVQEGTLIRVPSHRMGASRHPELSRQIYLDCRGCRVCPAIAQAICKMHELRILKLPYPQSKHVNGVRHSSQLGAMRRVFLANRLHTPDEHRILASMLVCPLWKMPLAASAYMALTPALRTP